MEARAFIAAPLILLLVVYQSLYPIASAQDQIPPAPQFPTQSQPAQSQTQTAVMPTADELRTFLAPIALYPDQLLAQIDRKSTRLNSSHLARSRMPSSA